MEYDRAEVDIGEAVDVEAVMEDRQQARRPQKRFVGRKEAADRAQRAGEPSGTMEDIGTVQSQYESQTA